MNTTASKGHYTDEENKRSSPAVLECAERNGILKCFFAKDVEH